MNKLKKVAMVVGTNLTALSLAASTAFAAIDIGEDVQPGSGFAENFGSLFNALLSFVMIIAALMVFLYLIWGGIEWITSGGDKGKTESARNKITAAVIGLIVVAASYAILTLALNFLGFSSLNEVFSKARGIND